MELVIVYLLKFLILVSSILTVISPLILKKKLLSFNKRQLFNHIKLDKYQINPNLTILCIPFSVSIFFNDINIIFILFLINELITYFVISSLFKQYKKDLLKIKDIHD